jgi:uncharacterized membrane protein
MYRTMSSLATATEILVHASEWLKLLLETLGALSIAAGMCAAVADLVRGSRAGNVHFTATRFTLARHLALALEFQLASDILETAISPEWQKIGELAAIAAIRTALNYFLTRELKEGQQYAGTPASP